MNKEENNFFYKEINTKNSNETTTYNLFISIDDSYFEMLIQYETYIYYGLFTNVFIENLSYKTGNYKKFDIFIKMLINSLEENDNENTVILDILTYNDLLKLRSSNEEVEHDDEKNINKRYVILTYTVKYDQIHYPMTLKRIDLTSLKDQKVQFIKFILKMNKYLFQSLTYEKKQINVQYSIQNNVDSVILGLKNNIDELNRSLDSIKLENLQLTRENVKLITSNKQIIQQNKQLKGNQMITDKLIEKMENIQIENKDLTLKLSNLQLKYDELLLKQQQQKKKKKKKKKKFHHYNRSV